MSTTQPLAHLWAALPAGAQAALTQQWAGLAAGGLPCGAALTNAAGEVIASGRNHSYDPAGPLTTRLQYPLQHSRLAHAELNALACLPTEADHAALTLWTTQHPCAMCAAAVQFVGIGAVCFIADDPSDDSPAATIVASRGSVDYQHMQHQLWQTICNLLFLYNSAVQRGAHAGNLIMNRDRSPQLVQLTLELAGDDRLGHAARSGIGLIDALTPHYATLAHVAKQT